MIASSLKIMLWDKEIGRLSWDARKGVSFFEYNPAFLGGGLDPFPLVASVKSPASRRPIMGDREAKLYRKLPPFLAGSLPDAWGNFENVRVEKAYKGNYHLLCEVEGKGRKFVINNKKEQYALIDKVGIDNLTDKQLCSLVETFFVR